MLEGTIDSPLAAWSIAVSKASRSPGVSAPLALSGPRYELFSMTAAAAAHGLGLALVPRLLIETELARGELVVACDQVLRGERSYYLVTPERADERPVVGTFKTWLQQKAPP